MYFATQYAAAVSSLRRSVGAVVSELSSIQSSKAKILNVPDVSLQLRLHNGSVGEESTVECLSGGSVAEAGLGLGLGDLGQKKKAGVADIDDLACLEARIRYLASYVQSHVVENDADNRLLREGLVRLLK